MALQVWVSLLFLSACSEAYEPETSKPETCPEVKLVGLKNTDRLAVLQCCQEAVGPLGIAGPAGVTGPAGEPGIRGLKGDPGPPGQTGPVGNSGAAGPKGDRGAVGPKGDTPDVASVLCQKGPRSCTDILNGGNSLNGWYSIYLPNCRCLQVFCDMETDGGGWIVLQKRMDGSVDFYRNYKSYKRGFGLQGSEFWIGLDNFYILTQAGNMALRVDLEDFSGKSTFAEYETFTILDETKKYQLRLGRFLGGTAGDSLSPHNGKPFSTYDQDNDDVEFNCAVVVRGAWWYYTCYSSNLNGAYAKNGKETLSYGVDWSTGNGIGKSYKRTEMKIR